MKARTGLSLAGVGLLLEGQGEFADVVQQSGAERLRPNPQFRRTSFAVQRAEFQRGDLKRARPVRMNSTVTLSQLQAFLCPSGPEPSWRIQGGDSVFKGLKAVGDSYFASVGSSLEFAAQQAQGPPNGPSPTSARRGASPSSPRSSTAGATRSPSANGRSAAACKAPCRSRMSSSPAAFLRAPSGRRSIAHQRPSSHDLRLDEAGPRASGQSLSRARLPAHRRRGRGRLGDLRLSLGPRSIEVNSGARGRPLALSVEVTRVWPRPPWSIRGRRSI